MINYFIHMEYGLLIIALTWGMGDFLSDMMHV